MCHIISFDFFQKTKDIFLVWPLGGFFIAFQLRLLELWFYLLFFLQGNCLEPLDNWSWLLVAWIDYVKINHQILGLLMRQRRYEYKIHTEAYSFKIYICTAWDVLGVCAMRYWVEFMWCCYHMVDLLLDL